MGFSKFPPFLLIICGKVGTGKTYLARHLAETAGFIHLRSDTVRKRMFNIPLLSHSKAKLDQGIYNPKITERVYKKLIEEASLAISKNKPVVLDATFGKKIFRERIIALAKKSKIPYCFIECVTPPKTILKRLRRREKTKEVSDADAIIFLKKEREFDPIEISRKHYLKINTDSSIKSQKDKVLRKISSLIKVKKCQE